MEKKLFEICLSGNTIRTYQYFVAKDEKQAMEKAKKQFPYMSIISINFEKFIYV